jgi:histidinol phosphatase-like enzyme (inositol monophosphatase family)
MYRFPRLQLPPEILADTTAKSFASSPNWPVDLQISPVEYSQRIQFSLELAQIASNVTLGFFRTKAYQVERKSDRSPVTAADKGAEQAVRQAISQSYPQDGLLGEEFGSVAGQNDFEWIIDPIDGTKSFISGVPLYSTLVGLTYRGQPLIGVIAIPALGEVVLGAVGCGAWYGQRDPQAPTDDSLSMHRCHVSSLDALSEGLFLTSQVDNFDRRSAQHAYLALQQEAYVSRSWGDGYGYLLVATGRGELMVDPIVNPWDVAAVAPVIMEAGGKFTCWSGEVNLRAGHCLASNGLVHDYALSVLKPFANHQ